MIAKYMRTISRKALAVIVALAMLLAMTPLQAWETFAEDGKSVGNAIDMSDIAPAESGTGWTYDGSNGAYTITGDVTVTGNNEESNRHLEVLAGPEVSISLENATINVSSHRDTSPLKLNKDAKVDLAIEGDNNLTAGWGQAGINVPEGATLSISGSALNDALTAEGGGQAAGIGGVEGESGGTITISGGTVNASGYYGAGIGGGWLGNGGTITISGGLVNATSRYYGAGIGGGAEGDGGKVTISGGIVAATGGSVGGSGIGGGYHMNVSPATGGDITICGKAAVTATRGGDADDIGGGYSISGAKGLPGNQFIAALVNNNPTESYKVVGDPTLAAGLTANIPAGQTMTVNKDSTLTVNGAIDVYGALALGSESTIDNNGTVNIYGKLNNYGTLNNYGAITIEKGGGFTGNGAVGGNPVMYAGADVSKPAVNGAPTETMISVNAVSLAGDTGQSVEYAVSTEQAEPQSGWQDGAAFAVLTPGTTYYVFARSKIYENTTENKIYLAGKASVSDPIATKTATTENPVPLRDIPGAKTPVEAGTTARLPKSVIFDDLTRADVTWTSADPSIAAIDPYGNLIGVKEGKATLTATAKDGKTQTVAITVAKNVTTIRTPQKAIHMQRGQALTPPVCADSMNPATNKADTTAKLTWGSSDTKIATVNAATGKIKAKKSGKAKITATALNGKKLTITVNVETKAIALKTLTLKKAPNSLKAGKARLLSVKTTPYTATNLKITFSSSNEKILSVDKAGKLTAKKKGTAKITIKASGKKYVKAITVK
jgi:uncharacterized protein YjdB